VPLPLNPPSLQPALPSACPPFAPLLTRRPSFCTTYATYRI
jgi:hypothetical protein